MSAAPESRAAALPASPPPGEPVVLIIAPLAGDADTLSEMCAKAGFASRRCGDPGTLREALHPDPSAVLFVVATHEAASEAVADILIEANASQPEWSSLPIVLLLRDAERPPRGFAPLIEAAGQPPLLLVERPVKPATLEGLFAMQARARRQQFENRRLVEKLRAEEAYKDFLLRELRHRTGNSLAILQSLFRLTASRHRDVDTLVKDFSGRFTSLMGAYSRLTPGPAHRASLATVLRDHVAPYALDTGQLALDGPEVRLEHKASFNLAMVVHELATNAAKYGALSVPHGTVRVSWSVEGDGEDGSNSEALVVRWQECDGPRVTEPDSEGLGTMVIGTFARSGGIDGEISYRAQGLVWTGRMPHWAFEASA